MRQLFCAIFVVALLTGGGSALAQKKSKKAAAKNNESVTEAPKPDVSKPGAVAVDSTALLQEYVGAYNVTGTSDFSQAIITFENGKLYGRADVQPEAAPLTPTATPDVFSIYSPQGSLDITFLRDENKKVTALKFFLNGTEIRGQKAK